MREEINKIILDVNKALDTRQESRYIKAPKKVVVKPIGIFNFLHKLKCKK